MNWTNIFGQTFMYTCIISAETTYFILFCSVEYHDCRSIFHLVMMIAMVFGKDDDASAKECFHSIKDSLDHSPLLITGALTQFLRGSNEEDSIPLFSLFTLCALMKIL